MKIFKLCLKSILSFSILFFLSFAIAHPWSEVHYRVKVDSMTKEKVSIILEKILKYDGFVRPNKKTACKNKGKQMFVKLSQVKKGRHLLLPNVQLEAHYSYSSGPMRKGKVVEDPTSWAFYPIRKDTPQGMCGSEVNSKKD